MSVIACSAWRHYHISSGQHDTTSAKLSSGFVVVLSNLVPCICCSTHNPKPDQTHSAGASMKHHLHPFRQHPEKTATNCRTSSIDRRHALLLGAVGAPQRQTHWPAGSPSASSCNHSRIRRRLLQALCRRYYHPAGHPLPRSKCQAGKSRAASCRDRPTKPTSCSTWAWPATWP